MHKNRQIPRKEWMTFGLAKSCATKSELYRVYKNSKSDEAKNTFLTYRNRLQKLLNKTENEFYSKRLNECHGDQNEAGK